MSTSTFYINEHLMIDATNFGSDFYLHVFPNLNRKDKRTYEPISNPWLGNSKLSLCIYFNGREWLYKDLHSEDFKGNVFDFAALHYGLDPKKDMQKIMLRMFQDLKLDPSEVIGESVAEVPETKEKTYNTIAYDSVDDFASSDEIDLEEHQINIPEEVYDSLPEILKHLTEEFKVPHEKDLALLSSLAVLSSCFPYVKGFYNRRLYGLNLFLFVSAPPASGKGVMNFSRQLVAPIHKHLKQKYLTQMETFEELMEEYEEKRKSKSLQLGTKPEKPLEKKLFISANTSHSKMIEILAANENFGLMFDSEADTLSNTIKSEWGDLSSTLRKAFEYEMDGKERVIGKSVEVPSPHLSVVLSGTPNQVQRLIKEVENGFFSRFIFYSYNAIHKWQNKFDNSGTDLNDHFKDVGDIFLQHWKENENRTAVRLYLTPQQIEEFNSFFDKRYNTLLSEYGGDVSASIYRIAVVAYRIAMILTCIRCVEEDRQLNDKDFVSDTDFKNALRIIETMMNHLGRVIDNLKEGSEDRKLSIIKQRLYDVLPKYFSTKEIFEIADTFQIKRGTAEKYVRQLVNKGLLVRLQQSKYQKV